MRKTSNPTDLTITPTIGLGVLVHHFFYKNGGLVHHFFKQKNALIERLEHLKKS